MRILTLLMLIMFAKTVLSDPVEIGTVGKTYALPEEYQAASQLSDVMKRQVSQQYFVLPTAHEMSMISAFPVTTTLKLGSTAFSKSIPSLEEPLFIVGTDKVSQEWVVKHKTYLNSLKARGLIVQANNFEEINALAKTVPDLKLMVTNGDTLLEKYSVTHYPILLEREKK